MPAKNPAPKKTPQRPSRLNDWFRAYIDASNPVTYLNKKESARAAGYRTEKESSLGAIGWQNYNKLRKKITAWQDEHGLSDNALRDKLISLLDGRQTKTEKIKGAVDVESLPPGWYVVTKTGVLERSEDGTGFSAGETLLACDSGNLELQRRTLDMALKVKGLYAAEKREHSGPGGGPIESRMTMFPPEPQSVAEWVRMKKELEEDATK